MRSALGASLERSAEGPQNEGIGQSVLRKEDFRFITGRGRYTSDIVPPGALHAAFVRSPHAFARVKGIDISAAMDIPGVVAGEDLQGDSVGILALDFVARNFDGRPMVTPARRALTLDIVRYVGEPVAIVIAQTRHLAEDGVEAVSVDYEALPAVVEVTRAIASDAPLLHPDAEENVSCDFRYGKSDDVAKVLSDARDLVKTVGFYPQSIARVARSAALKSLVHSDSALRKIRAISGADDGRRSATMAATGGRSLADENGKKPDRQSRYHLQGARVCARESSRGSSVRMSIRESRVPALRA